jgi:hypothetical protein
MIEDIYIIHHESGVPLLHVDFRSGQNEGNEVRPSADLFGGALQGIRLFLKECKIGDLTEFTTNDRRIEVRCDKTVVVAIVFGLDSPPHEVVDILVEDVAALFESEFKDKLRSFNGNVNLFNDFIPELVKFVTLELDPEAVGYEVPAFREGAKEAMPKQAAGSRLARKRSSVPGHGTTEDLSSLTDWLKNRYGLDASIQINAHIKIPQEPSELVVNAIVDAGDRHLNRLDRWLAPRMCPGGTRAVTLAFFLRPSHGPAYMRPIIETCCQLGDPESADLAGVFSWFPAEIVFIGPAVQRSTFDGLGDIIKEYKDGRCIIASYADHVHREHSPHHAFFRSSVSGWRWKPGSITADNFPVQVFPR